jgi:group I intron endonuclease
MKGIYKIINTVNRKFYIGSSKNILKRIRRHFSELRNNSHKNKHLQSSWNKYGEENFLFEILEECLEENLIVREQYYIDVLIPKYNINKIANSSLGVKRDDITKEKIRRANIGLKHSKERNEIKSIAQGGDNHWTKKKEFSEESKEKMRKTHKKLHKNGYKHPTAKKVIELDVFGKEVNSWTSLIKAGIYYKVDAMTIYNIIKGKNSKKLKGKIFKYG